MGIKVGGKNTVMVERQLAARAIQRVFRAWRQVRRLPLWYLCWVTPVLVPCHIWPFLKAMAHLLWNIPLGST